MNPRPFAWTVSLRPFTWADLPAYARVHNEARRAVGSAPFTERDAEEYLRQPNLRPEHDCFIAEVDGEPAGVVLVVPELSIGRVILEWAERPAFHGGGVAERFLTHAVERGRSLGARAAHVSALGEQTGIAQLFTELGFAEVKRQWRMRVDVRDFSPGRPASGYQVRPMAAGEEPLMTDIQNRAFAGSWGFAPNTAEEIAYRLRVGGAGPRDTLLMISGGKPIAYCWTRLSPDFPPSLSEPALSPGPVAGSQGKGQGVRSTGIIWMIGVDPAARGGGFGRAMLDESVAYLRGKGAQAIELTVYQDNTPAVALYRSAGFRPVQDIIWYEKRLAV